MSAKKKTTRRVRAAAKKARRPESLRSIGRRHQVCGKTVAAWRDKGIDIYDDVAIARFRQAARQKGAAALDEDLDDKDLVALKKEDLREAIRLKRLRADKEEGRLVEARSVREQGIFIGSQVNAIGRSMENDLPGELEGLTAAKMKPLLRDWWRTTAKDIERLIREAIAQALHPSS